MEGSYSWASKWKFAPPKPKAETAAVRTLSVCQGIVFVITLKGLFDQSTIGLGVSKLIEGGKTLFFKANITLIKEAIPAADFVCPIWLLTEPSPIVPGFA